MWNILSKARLVVSVLSTMWNVIEEIVWNVIYGLPHKMEFHKCVQACNSLYFLSFFLSMSTFLDDLYLIGGHYGWIFFLAYTPVIDQYITVTTWYPDYVNFFCFFSLIFHLINLSLLLTFSLLLSWCIIFVWTWFYDFSFAALLEPLLFYMAFSPRRRTPFFGHFICLSLSGKFTTLFFCFFITYCYVY